MSASCGPAWAISQCLAELCLGLGLSALTMRVDLNPNALVSAAIVNQAETLFATKCAGWISLIHWLASSDPLIYKAKVSFTQSKHKYSTYRCKWHRTIYNLSIEFYKAMWYRQSFWVSKAQEHQLSFLYVSEAEKHYSPVCIISEAKENHAVARVFTFQRSQPCLARITEWSGKRLVIVTLDLMET